MNVDGVAYRSIWVNNDGWSVDVIDQTRLPHAFEVSNLQNLDDACAAIRDMVVQPPLIDGSAGFSPPVADAAGRSGAGHRRSSAPLESGHGFRSYSDSAE